MRKHRSSAVRTFSLNLRNASAASDLLKPYDVRLMRYYLVSTRLNHVANDDAECCAPVELAGFQDRRFS